jgi:hypothetical protein
MSDITKNDCQSEDDFMAYYSKLSALEAKLFKAIGIAFQLKDFGHNVNDEIDGECFETNKEQEDRFTEANKVALSAAMGIVGPEISALKEKLNEAMEIIRELDAELVSAARTAVEIARDEGLHGEAMILEVGINNPDAGTAIFRARSFLKENENG